MRPACLSHRAGCRPVRRTGHEFCLHLQFTEFIDAPGKPNRKNLARLGKAIDLAEELGLYLDIAGLGTYRLKDVPALVSRRGREGTLGDVGRVPETIAPVCADRQTVFAYNLMNEPMATGSKPAIREVDHPTALEGQTYIEYINSIRPAATLQNSRKRGSGKWARYPCACQAVQPVPRVRDVR